jgi:hypothetical protein
VKKDLNNKIAMICFNEGVSFLKDGDVITIGGEVSYTLRDFDIFSKRKNKVLGVGNMSIDEAANAVFEDFTEELILGD